MAEPTPVARRADWIISAVTGAHMPVAAELDEIFTPSLLEAIGAEPVVEGLAQLRSAGQAAVEDVSEAGLHKLTCVFNFGAARLRMLIAVEEEDPHRINYLYFGPDESEIFAAGVSRTTDEAIAEHAAPFARSVGDAGVVVGVVSDAADVLTVFGPVAADALFEIGSVTKPLVGVLLAEMVSRSEVSYETTVKDILRCDVRAGDITLLDLATHSSGLPRIAPNKRDVDIDDPYATFGEAELLEALATTEPEYERGTRQVYSNFGFGLLGFVLSRVAGASFDELVRERVCVPCAMGETFANVPEAMAARRVDGHAASGAVVAHWSFLDASAGAGAIESTMRDMLAFVGANLDPESTSIADALEDAQRARIASGDRERMALGWRAHELDDGSLVHMKNGGTGGFRSMVAFHRESGNGIAILVNSSGVHPDGVALRVLADLIAT